MRGVRGRLAGGGAALVEEALTLRCAGADVQGRRSARALEDAIVVSSQREE